MKTNVFRFDDLVIESGSASYIPLNPGNKSDETQPEAGDPDDCFGYTCPYIINGVFYLDRRTLFRREFDQFKFDDPIEKIEPKLRRIAKRLLEIREPSTAPDYYDWQTLGQLLEQ